MKTAAVRRQIWVALLGAAALIVPAFAVVEGPALPALADGVTCNDIHHNWTGFYWTDGSYFDVQGVRAPISVRKDGSLCNPTGHPNSSDSTWIAVVDGNNGSNIVQIGYLRYWKSGVSTICKFWATQGGAPQTYQCGGYTDDELNWFTIHPWNDGTQYIIADCGGSGGYADADCNAESSGQSVYSNPVGEIYQEEYYGCGLHIFGSSGDPEHAGVSYSYVQGEGTGLNWSARTWTVDGDNCGNGAWGSDYNHTQSGSGQIMNWWDDRNSS